MQKKVNLFIVGAMKAGTTSFADMLTKHSEVFFCPIKEPHHFITNTPSSVYGKTNFDVKKYLSSDTLDPIHLEIIKDLEDYHQLYRSATDQHKYLAEASTGYYHSPESAQLLYDYNPDAKIIILNRDPYKRAYSHFKMDTGLGRITEDFETVLKKEISDFRKNGIDPWDHLGMSIYEPNNDKFKNLFKDNVLVIDFEKYIKNPEVSRAELFRFLGMKHEDLVLPHQNSSKEIKYKKLVKFLFDSGIKDLGSKLLPKSIRTKIFNSLQQESKDSGISENTLNEFNAIISSYNK